MQREKGHLAMCYPSILVESSMLDIAGSCVVRTRARGKESYKAGFIAPAFATCFASCATFASAIFAHEKKHTRNKKVFLLAMLFFSPVHFSLKV